MKIETYQDREDYAQKDSKYEQQEQEAVNPQKPERNSKKELKEFKKQASKIVFNPLGSRENYPGNYDNYLKIALSHISELRKIRFEYALSNKK